LTKYHRNRPVDRPILLSTRSFVRQEQHPHHCVCVGAPTYHLEFLLLWSTDACLHVPRCGTAFSYQTSCPYLYRTLCVTHFHAESL